MSGSRRPALPRHVRAALPRHVRRCARVAIALAVASCAPPPHQAPVDLAAPAAPVAADFSSEVDLAARMPALGARWGTGEDGFFAGVAGARIHYHVVRAAPERAAVVVLPGRTEAAQKYIEVAADLVARGYSAYVLDHRGQGASARFTANPQQGYVEFFRDYVDDLQSFLQQVVRRDRHARVFVLAHSMGGAVAALHIDRFPGGFDAAVLSSPMFELNTGAFPAAVASSLALTDCSITDGQSYAIGSHDYAEEPSVATSTVTHSAARWQAQIELYRAVPALRVGGLTYRWLCEALNASDRASRVGAGSTTPTLLLTAGADSVVRPGGQQRYCDDAPRCQREVIPGAFHEILSEQDALRNAALAHVVRFFDHFVQDGR